RTTPSDAAPSCGARHIRAPARECVPSGHLDASLEGTGASGESAVLAPASVRAQDDRPPARERSRRRIGRSRLVLFAHESDPVRTTAGLALRPERLNRVCDTKRIGRQRYASRARVRRDAPRDVPIWVARKLLSGVLRPL